MLGGPGMVTRPPWCASGWVGQGVGPWRASGPCGAGCLAVAAPQDQGCRGLALTRAHVRGAAWRLSSSLGGRYRGLLSPSVAAHLVGSGCLRGAPSRFWGHLRRAVFVWTSVTPRAATRDTPPAKSLFLQQLRGARTAHGAPTVARGARTSEKFRRSPCHSLRTKELPQLTA